MNILVTGGAGYVGSHAVRLLSQAGYRVWVYDNLSLGHAQACPDAPLIVGDLSDGPRLTAALQEHRIDAVMHFAALTLVGESVTSPGKYYANNVLGSLSLLDAMRAANVSRIVVSSTAATFGTPEKMPISEDAPQNPINPYGFTKLVVERALADYAHAHGLAYAALRYFNASGASPQGDIGEDHTPESHLIPLVLQVALGQRERIAVFGEDYPTPDGTCIRDYVHVDDLADAHLRALDRLQPGRGLHFNLGTGRGYSVREVIDSCRRVTRHPIPIVSAPRREGDPPELIAGALRAREQLDWTPRYLELDAIVSTAWRWHSTHPQGYSRCADERR